MKTYPEACEIRTSWNLVKPGEIYYYRYLSVSGDIIFSGPEVVLETPALQKPLSHQKMVEEDRHGYQRFHIKILRPDGALVMLSQTDYDIGKFHFMKLG